MTHATATDAPHTRLGARAGQGQGVKSQFPVTQTTGIVTGATVVLATSASTCTGTPMPYLWLAATTLFGCAAARIIRNERVATP